MRSADVVVNSLGIAYGLLLVLAAFVRHRLTDALRIDVLFMRRADERTRVVNLLAGIAIAGYGIYSLTP